MCNKEHAANQLICQFRVWWMLLTLESIYQTYAACVTEASPWSLTFAAGSSECASAVAHRMAASLPLVQAGHPCSQMCRTSDLLLFNNPDAKNCPHHVSAAGDFHKEHMASSGRKMGSFVPEPIHCPSFAFEILLGAALACLDNETQLNQPKNEVTA